MATWSRLGAVLRPLGGTLQVILNHLGLARAILDLGKLTMALPGLLGEEAAPIPLKKETSGHYSVKILAMDGAVNSLEAERIFINEDWSTERAEKVVCLLLNS